MRRTQAWERLHDRDYASSLSTEEFYNLLIDAGYNRKIAQKAANERGYNRLRAGMKM